MQRLLDAGRHRHWIPQLNTLHVAATDAPTMANHQTDRSFVSEYERDLTHRQSALLAYLPKPFALLSFLASSWVAYTILHRRPERKRKLYHRLILLMSVNGMINAGFFIWGGWAIPSYAGGQVHNVGTEMTCTVQGFVLQVSSIVVPFYYASLSLYVYCAVKHDFQMSAIGWIEKWIHGTVYVFPLASAAYLAHVESYNSVGPWCWINSYPAGCNHSTDVECERGTNHPDKLVLAFGAMPVVLLLTFATVTMVLCYQTEKRKGFDNFKSMRGKNLVLEAARQQKSRLIARQGSVYLGSFYVSYLFPVIAGLVQIITEELHFPTMILGAVFMPMDGFFFSLAYLRLLSDEDKREDGDDGGQQRRGSLNSINSSYTNTPEQAVAVGGLDPNIVGAGSKKRRPSIRRNSGNRVSIFDGADTQEERWKQFGVYVGDEEDDVDEEGMGGIVES